ncbi:MAG: hypothetical protein KKB90_03345 [Actinobacteria bacterium]|nr:hypothetical protein [Actinomycetota bacterium]MCG2819555.1 hypothetical protein [Actinomycetes bacterium]MBU4217980.1 hypothetical protein [Actinomycetota bacterium]MBU4358245.1 hypothetical protein [Actinomycetota bacterium]MBU4391209.1 hypothetical protein [Actinomycetota bacterium]
MRVALISDTHVDLAAWEKAMDGVMLVNAGSCAIPKQDGEAPTVGLLEDGRVTIFNIDSGDVLIEEMLPGHG